MKINLIKPVIEFFRAYYDPNLDKINGCEKGSLAWFHEDRHREQFRNNIFNSIVNTTHILFYSVSFCILYLGLAGGIFKESLTLIGLISLPYLALLLLAEIDAWIMGIYRYLRSKRGD